ncbi:MAG: GDP-L-fucose synthase family protein, partial [Gemmatimonadaceae bacterium]
MGDAFPRIFVAGHRGLVGSAIVRALNARGCQPVTRSREELDLTDARAVRDFFQSQRFEVVYLAAARVGGIVANDTFRWEFLYENLLIETSVLGAALETEVDRVIFFGSSCIYPRLAAQPIVEEALLTGPLEQTNEPYALAKIVGVKLVDAANARYGRNWLSLMPTNLYGPGDNFDLQNSHVLPAMIRKFHEAKTVALPGDRRVFLWGTGTVRREFLYVDDLADAALFLGGSSTEGLINVGSGSDLTVAELAALVA